MPTKPAATPTTPVLPTPELVKPTPEKKEPAAALEKPQETAKPEVKPAVAEKAAEPVEKAPAPEAADEGKLSKTLTYAKGKTNMSDSAKGDLASIAEKAKESQGSVRIVAYAGGKAEEV
jgi:outer membrane protein OmpA-like peptidoglycan-associated protein